ncbi:hypothetical protein GUR46_18575 [Stenotrophomonas maltophilia]|uniref:hypothetical protein n=1 Tax=Stenotrophomonas maltophilia TaxID=40324 RepID=UPI001F20692C|nr:hypothetical protein [Stenotrophomonas maltophilia]MCF3530881.1 hypothetical protein [Stenotrophomonas maltophilia]MCF3534765.1 hypothetical protein [Stenotrophomonas maltophilia]
MLYRALALAALVLATASLFSCQQGRVSRATTALDKANLDLAKAIAENAALASSLELAEGTTRVVTEYVDRVQVVHERGDTIVKEVPIYVTANADAACTVSAGFVQLHDTAASGNATAGPAGDPDAPAAATPLSVVAETVASNYATCHATAAQVVGLQELARELHADLERQAGTP